MRILWTALCAAVLLTAQTWQTATELPGLDLSGLSPAQKAAALKILREEGCNCGCSMKIAQCRMEDPACSYSRSLAMTAIRELKAGKPAGQVRAKVHELAEQGPPPKTLEDPVPISIDGDPFRGPADAKVTIVEFSDFQCPYCSAAAPAALKLVDQFSGRVKLVFKQFPLDMHKQAHLAAEASLAAHAQRKFWPLHDKMFANFRQLSRDNILKWAGESGLDVQRFTADLDSGKYRAAVDREIQQGTEAGVNGTPTFFVDGKRYNGPIENIGPVIEAELRGGSAAGPQPAAASQAAVH
jgi:protein-disulfide isomerase